jgi:prophage maintenance system killer protein
MHIANSDKPVAFYSLDVILAVGYRANSTRAIEFRKWATKVLHQYITRGYTINRTAIAAHYDEFMKAVDDIRALLPVNHAVDSAGVLDLIRTFADTWLSLDAYDKDVLEIKGVTKKQSIIIASELESALVQLKHKLIENGEATNLFGAERSVGAIEGIVGNVMQSFAGKAMYPSIEEKAAHLLYFVVKNHPFIDGNKRSGAFAFVWFLRRTKRLDSTHMSPEALTVLTLLIAESNPKNKQKMIGLVCRLLINKPNSTL